MAWVKSHLRKVKTKRGTTVTKRVKGYAGKSKRQKK